MRAPTPHEIARVVAAFRRLRRQGAFLGFCRRVSGLFSWREVPEQENRRLMVALTEARQRTRGFSIVIEQLAASSGLTVAQYREREQIQRQQWLREREEERAATEQRAQAEERSRRERALRDALKSGRLLNIDLEQALDTQKWMGGKASSMRARLEQDELEWEARQRRALNRWVP